MLPLSLALPLLIAATSVVLLALPLLVAAASIAGSPSIDWRCLYCWLSLY